jgi:hypothetical protein
MNVWRWDKKEPLLRFPLKEELSVLRMSPQNASLCLGGSKKGRLSIWHLQTG